MDPHAPRGMKTEALRQTAFSDVQAFGAGVSSEPAPAAEQAVRVMARHRQPDHGRERINDHFLTTAIYSAVAGRSDSWPVWYVR